MKAEKAFRGDGGTYEEKNIKFGVGGYHEFEPTDRLRRCAGSRNLY